MCPVWKPLHNPPTLSWYSSLSEDAQRIIAVLENKYSNTRQNQCSVKTENPTSDPQNYYRSIYEYRFKAELPSSSSLSRHSIPGCSSTTSDSGIVHHTQTDNHFSHSFRNTDCNNNPISPASLFCQSPQQSTSQTSHSNMKSSFRHDKPQHPKHSDTDVSKREVLDVFSHSLDSPEFTKSLTLNNRIFFDFSVGYPGESPTKFSNSLNTEPKFSQTTLSGCPGNKHFDQNSQEHGVDFRYFDREPDSSTSAFFKIPPASKPCLSNFSPHHGLKNKRKNISVLGREKTCQMKITDCLKQICKPQTFINTAISCDENMNSSSIHQFKTRDPDPRSKVAKKQPLVNSLSQEHEVEIKSSNSVLCETLNSLGYSGEASWHKRSLLDVDCSLQRDVIQKLRQDHTRNKAKKLDTFDSTSDAACGEISIMIGTGHTFEIVDNKATTPSCKRSNKTSEGLCNVNVDKKCSKKRQSTFQAPFVQKKSKDMTTSNMTAAQESMSDTAVKLTDMSSLSDAEWKNLTSHILNSHEICITLVYSDNSTLLNLSHSGESTRKHGGVSKKVTHLAMKITSSASLSDCKFEHILLFPLEQGDPSYLQWFRLLVKDLMSNPVPRKIAVNAKDVFVELLTFLKEKDAVSWYADDPAVGAWLLNSEKSAQSLRDVLLILGMDCPQYTESSSWIDTLNAEFTVLHQAMARLEKKLKSHNLWKLFSEVECPLISLLATMEIQQFRVDTKTFIVFSDVLKKKLSRLEEKAFGVIGHSFCINSHPQLRQVLYEELQLDKKLPLKTKIAKTSIAQQKSTSEAMLNQLVDIHPLPAIVLEYRQLQKLKSTYVDGMLACVNDGYLRTHWDQTAAATGRLTSYQPNIQAIPKTSVTVTDYEISYIAGKSNDKKVEIFAREPYISHDEHLLLAADFQQIELRLFAHLSDDQTLLDLFKRKTHEDIFIQLTAQWLKKPSCDVTASEREQTKRIVYSVMYGVGKERLSEYLKVTPENAKAIMDSFLKKFPAVNSFTKKCVEFCQEHGYTSTIFNRRRQIPHIHHPSYQMRAQAARQAVNFCVQGSAADLCKAAMLKVDKELKSHGNLHTKLLVQIHDELLWEVPENELNSVKEIVKGIMEHCDKLCGEMVKLKVPIRVSLSSGKSWAHLETCS
ncbi:DNA polymerase nu-like [Gigantopelta aegis]|uniref:DNA polymerase nu-like n=1 Tax=Gigantopelta aegis TaxID=1735272 RepID=UPI001B88E638|nr:DNA polymerase nu-like [Gigantopelta aegis]